MQDKRTVIYPGTFDPITNGHTDLITRASKLFDCVVIAVAEQPQKSLLLSLTERIELIEFVIEDIPNARVMGFSGLLVDVIEKNSMQAIIRGLRAVSDFDYEFQLALMNRRLNSRIETIFLTPAEENTFISSTLVREVASFKRDVSQFTHPKVADYLRQKFKP